MNIQSEESIKSRISQMEFKLKKIEVAIKKELDKDFFDRDRFVFLFLDTEKKIYSSALNELKWVLNE